MTVDRDRRAISPVIGVILMVAITVILSAVIGSFVLLIGDQSEAAPAASFETSQGERYYDSNFHPGDDVGGGPLDDRMRSNDCDANLTTVTITHMGGDTLDISNTNLLIEGNGSAWKAEDRSVGPVCSGVDDRGIPQPNLLKTLGRNSPVPITAGTEWAVIGSGDGEPDIRGYEVQADHNLKSSHDYEIEFGTTDTGEERAELYHDDGGDPNGLLRLIATTDELSIVWSASSGGKTQRLFEYSAQ
jgi:flagellin-like protein